MISWAFHRELRELLRLDFLQRDRLGSGRAAATCAHDVELTFQAGWAIPSTNGGFKLGQIIYNRLVLWNINFIFPYIGNSNPS